MISKAIKKMESIFGTPLKKVWAAAVRATDVLVLAKTGVRPKDMSERGRRLGELILRNSESMRQKVGREFIRRAMFCARGS